MLNHSDTYQSFFPTLKYKSTSGKALVPRALDDLKTKILNIKANLNNKIPSVQKNKSSSNLSQIVSTSMQTQNSKSNKVVKIEYDKPRLATKLKKKHSESIMSIYSNIHSRNFSTVDQGLIELYRIKPVLDGRKNEISKKVALTERKKKKHNLQKKRLKILDSPVKKCEDYKIRVEIPQPTAERRVEKTANFKEKKVILLDKLNECNESLISSLSSTVYGQAPRYN